MSDGLKEWLEDGREVLATLAVILAVSVPTILVALAITNLAKSLIVYL